MVHQIPREELYRLVWSEPIKQLAPRFGISDVALMLNKSARNKSGGSGCKESG
jgi:hypothetical protein